MDSPAITAVSDPSHPAHKAFNWGIFFGFLALGLQSSGQVLSHDHPAIGAALTGGAQVLGPIDQAILAAQPPAEAQ